jgi:type I restriction enzyme S subunit
VTSEALAESASTLVDKGSVLIVVRSGILRRCIPVAINTVEVALNQDMKALQSKKIEARFLMFFILGNQEQLLILWRKQGSTVESLEQSLVGSTAILLPPREEQQAIVAYIDKETRKVETLISKYERELELLAEYRASLISHAVAGKIDVRGLVASAQIKEMATL